MGRSGRVRPVRGLPELGSPGGVFSGVVSVSAGTPYFTANEAAGRSRLYARMGGSWARLSDPCGGGAESDGVVEDGRMLIDVCTGYLGADQGAQTAAFQSIDDGTSWRQGGEVGYAKGPIAISSIGTVTYAADDEYGGHIYRSIDSGTHWTTIHTGPRPAAGWTAVDFPDPRDGFAVPSGRHARLFTTRDAGATWRSLSLHLSPAAASAKS